MAIRSRFRPGRHLVKDDVDGKVLWDDEVDVRWDGAIVGPSNMEPDHPQKYIRAKNDPYPVYPVRYDNDYPVFTDIDLQTHAYVDSSAQTVIRDVVGPADHLVKAGIGGMAIEAGHRFVRFRVA